MSDAHQHSEVRDAVLAFAHELAAGDDARLTAAWPAASEEGALWHGYDANLRDLTLLLDLKLHAMAAELAAGLPALTRAQRILARHHLAYRDATGALAAVSDAEFDRVPAPDEWPLRRVVYHMAGAEMGFSLLIGWAVDRLNSGDGRPITMPREEMEPHYETVIEEGTMAEVMERFERLHAGIQRDFSDLGDSDLEAPNVWWEGYEIPVWFRLHRFEAHLREHTIQIDKTLAMIGRSPTESERLARLLHGSLAGLESLLLVSPSAADGRVAELASEFDAARETLASLADTAG